MLAISTSFALSLTGSKSTTKSASSSKVGISFKMPLILLLYSLSWHMPHCCQKNLGKGMVSFKERILYRINNPTNYNDFSRKVILKFLGVNEHN